MAKKPRGPEPQGVLLLDKPVGLTSNAALQEAKRLLQSRKAGHTGSLDPLASGLLPLCFGEATKLSRFLLEAGKSYWTVFQLGVTTDTDDAEGRVLSTRPVQAGRAQVEAALKRFVGVIQQVPPLYSAIKRGGEPMYKLARAGLTPELEPRAVEIREIRLLDLTGDRVTLEMSCSKGTYVRSLARDLGEALGCGAHVIALRRLGLGAFRVEQAVTLDRLRELPGPVERAALLQPVDAAVETMPKVELSGNAAYYLRQGQAVTIGWGLPPCWVRIYEAGGLFLGVGEVQDDGCVAPKRLIHPPEPARDVETG